MLELQLLPTNLQWEAKFKLICDPRDVCFSRCSFWTELQILQKWKNRKVRPQNWMWLITVGRGQFYLDNGVKKRFSRKSTYCLFDHYLDWQIISRQHFQPFFLCLRSVSLSATCFSFRFCFGISSFLFSVLAEWQNGTFIMKTSYHVCFLRSGDDTVYGQFLTQCSQGSNGNCNFKEPASQK